MNAVTDVLIGAPMWPGVARGLLFLVFAIHFLFVLFTLGTAMLGVFYFRRPRAEGDAMPWDKEFLKSFFVHKSLAIVLGVGAILLMMLLNTVPFFTAVRIFPRAWMMLVVLLLASLGLLEYQAERKGEGKWRHLVAGTAGLVCLLAVPGVFAAVVATAENPRWWVDTLRMRMPFPLAVHWLFRFLHVLGAAAVFGAALHYLAISRPDLGKRMALRNWVMAGLAFQLVVGVALLGSLPRGPEPVMLVLIVTAVGASVILLWILSRPAHRLRPLAAVMLLSLILLPMLLTRQLLQEVVFVPVNRLAAANAREYAAVLSPYRTPAAGVYEINRMLDFRRPAAIYFRSCQFCHGAVGNGAGDQASALAVPPEDLGALRADRKEIHRVLLDGVDGSAMPRFGFYTEAEIGSLIDLLYGKFGMREKPERFPREIAAEDRLDAERVFASTCSICHDRGGQPSPFARGLRPAPPDFRRLSFGAQRAFDVITNGYPGTMMRSFAALPETTRWALVYTVQKIYSSDAAR